MNTKMPSVLAAAIAITAGPLLALPSAHAAANCVAANGLLNLRHSSGYDVAIDDSASSFGPQVVIRTPDVTSIGNITSGGITGRTLDFTIGWPGTKAYDHYTGTVGADGIAHGTSTGTMTPITLAEGTWDSVAPLTCS